VKPTEVQITSVKDTGNKFGVTDDGGAYGKPEVVASEDTAGHKKYTIRADRMYRAECRSKGSRPTAATEWYVLRKNQRYGVGQSAANVTGGAPSLAMPPVANPNGPTAIPDGKIAGVVETQHVSDARITYGDRAAITEREQTYGPFSCRSFGKCFAFFRTPQALRTVDVFSDFSSANPPVGVHTHRPWRTRRSRPRDVRPCPVSDRNRTGRFAVFDAVFV